MATPVPTGASASSTQRGRAGPNAPRARALFMILVVAGLLGFTLSPWLQRKSGIWTLDRWFLDSYAVLAASDAVKVGIDPTQANPLDVLQRPHSYTDWWFALGGLGFDRSDNFLVGGSWVLGFLLVTWATLRPRGTGEALWFAFLTLSPPMLLAIVRANNDLVIFVLLGVAALALRGPAAWQTVVAAIAIGAATGLKFYPAVALGALIVLRPPRRLLLALALSTSAVVGALWHVWPAFGRGVFPLPPSPYTMGAPILFRDLEWTGPAILPLGALIIAGAAAILVKRGVTSGLAGPLRPGPERLLFALGAAVLIGCFLAGASYAYRWVFALWLAPWLLGEGTATDANARRRTTARFTAALLMIVLWLDGLFCFALNVFLYPMAEAAREQLQLTWRLVTHPLTWLLMALLAGWLLEALLATVRELRGRRPPVPA